MIVIHASFPIDPDRRDDARSNWIEELVIESQREDGMIDYRATTDVSDPNPSAFSNSMKTKRRSAHAQSDHFQEFSAALPELLAGEPTVTRFDVESAEELEL